jgi:hypothetical protein
MYNSGDISGCRRSLIARRWIDLMASSLSRLILVFLVPLVGMEEMNNYGEEKSTKKWKNELETFWMREVGTISESNVLCQHVQSKTTHIHSTLMNKQSTKDQRLRNVPIIHPQTSSCVIFGYTRLATKR